MHLDDIWLLTDDLFEEFWAMLPELHQNIEKEYNVTGCITSTNKTEAFKALDALRYQFEEAKKESPITCTIIFAPIASVRLTDTTGPYGFLQFPITCAQDIFDKLSIYRSERPAMRARINICGALSVLDQDQFWTWNSVSLTEYMVKF